MISFPHRPISSTRLSLIKLVGSALLLPLALGACGGALGSPTAAALPGISWRKTESPLFPEAWPPGAETTWVSYTFAYGSNPARLQDGAYVTGPLAKTEWKAGVRRATQKLSQEMKQAGVQGVTPLDAATGQLLETGPQIAAACLKLTRLPEPAQPETRALLAYYQAWFKANGTFLGLIRASHAGFIDWVAKNPQTP